MVLITTSPRNVTWFRLVDTHVAKPRPTTKRRGHVIIAGTGRLLTATQKRAVDTEGTSTQLHSGRTIKGNYTEHSKLL